MGKSDRKIKKRKRGEEMKRWSWEGDRGLVPPTIESMREPRMSRSDAPEMGGIDHTLP